MACFRARLEVFGCVHPTIIPWSIAHIVLERRSISVGVYATSNGHEATNPLEQVALSVSNSVHCLLSKDGYCKKKRMGSRELNSNAHGPSLLIDLLNFYMHL